MAPQPTTHGLEVVSVAKMGVAAHTEAGLLTPKPPGSLSMTMGSVLEGSDTLEPGVQRWLASPRAATYPAV